MAIIDLDTWKTLTGTTGTTYDSIVTTLIPYVQADFVNICNYDFGQDTDDEEWPDGCQLDVAAMISFRVNTLGGDGSQYKSEKIGNYSYSVDDAGSSGYPSALEKSIRNKYRRANPKFGTYQLQYRDKRGLSPRSIVNHE